VTYNAKEDGIEKDGDSEETSDDKNEEVSDEKEETKDRGAQAVEIYVDDMDNDIREVNEMKTITEDNESSITLTIEQDRDGEYKVMRGEEMIENKTVTYEEGE